MKGTKAHIRASPSLQPHIAADHIDDIAAGPYLLDHIIGIKHLRCALLDLPGLRKGRCSLSYTFQAVGT